MAHVTSPYGPQYGHTLGPLPLYNGGGTSTTTTPYSTSYYGTLPALPGLGSETYTNPVIPTVPNPNPLAKQTGESTKAYNMRLASTPSPSAIAANEMAQAFAADRTAGINRNLQRRDTVLSGYDQRIGTGRALMDAYQPVFQAEQAAALNDLQGGFNLAHQGYQDRYSRNMDLVNRFGDSQRSDLEQKRAQQLAAANQAAVRRGLGNSTVALNLTRGVNSDFNRAGLDLEDRLLQNRLQTDQALSGDYLNSLIAGGTATSGLRERQNQYGTQLQQANLGREGQLTGDRLAFLAGYTDEYPTLADISNLYLQSGVLEETKKTRQTA